MYTVAAGCGTHRVCNRMQARTTKQPIAGALSVAHCQQIYRGYGGRTTGGGVVLPSGFTLA